MEKSFVRSAEDMAKAAARRLKREQKIQLERIRPAVNLLRTARICGIVALESSPVDYVLEGLKYKAGEGRILSLNASGNIQGAEPGGTHAEETLTSISRHRREHGFRGIIALTGFDFSGTTGLGTPQVTNRITEFILGQAKDDPAILLVGNGDITDLPTHPNFMDNNPARQHPVGSLVIPRLAMDVRGELSSFAGIETYAVPVHQYEATAQPALNPGIA